MWDDQHQMGTTRMHNNPKFGVADQNCRIWNIENIFVAGSSVFPTSGISINFTLYAR
jgi:choline dehydrogenase-like flavoprotein